MVLAQVLQLGDSEKLTFEGRPEVVSAWTAALSRLIAIVKQRRSYETLYGGTAQAPFSPRSRVVQNPRVRALLVMRQDKLLDAQQMRLLRRSGIHSGGLSSGSFNSSGGHTACAANGAAVAEPLSARGFHALAGGGSLVRGAAAPTAATAPILSSAIAGGRAAFASWAASGGQPPNGSATPAEPGPPAEEDGMARREAYLQLHAGMRAKYEGRARPADGADAVAGKPAANGHARPA